MAQPVQSRNRMTIFSGNLSEVLVSTVVINILALAMPLALLQVYDRIIPNQTFGTMTVLIAGVGLAVLLEILLRYGRSYLLGAAASNYEYQAGCDAFDHLLDADLAAYEQIGSGAIVERFDALQTAKEFYSGQAVLTLCDLPFAIIYVLLIWYIGGPVVYVPLLLIAIYLAIVSFSSGALAQAVRAHLQTEETRIGFLLRVLNGWRSIKSMALEKGICRRFEKLQLEKTEKAVKVDKLSATLVDQGNIFSQISTVGVVTVGAFAVMDGMLTTGGLAACTLLAGRALGPFTGIAGFWVRLQSVRAARERVASIFDLPSDRSGTGRRSQDVELTGSMRLSGLKFQSSSDQRVIFHDLELEIPAGSAIGITGPNGSGKSLLLTLMAGLASPTAGSVTLDGLSIENISREALRRQVVLLPQREVLFRGTIMENLTTFRPELERRAMLVAEALGIAEPISRMARGFRTQTGEGTAQLLSRSLIQQIAIARALVVPPKIILFDEANSAVDGAGDQYVKDAFRRLKGQCTLIIVSHRPSLLRVADQVYSLADGQLDPDAVLTEALL